MKQISRRTYLVAISGTVALFITALVFMGHLTDQRIERHRNAQIQLQRIVRLLPYLENLEHHLVQENEVEAAVSENVGTLLHSTYNILSDWERASPLGGRETVVRVSEAGHRYLNAYQQILLFYRAEQFEEGRIWRAERVHPALAQLKAELGVADASLKEAMEEALLQRKLLDMGGGLIGMALFLALLWRLERARMATRRLEEAQTQQEGRDRHIQAILRNTEGGVLIVGPDRLIQHVSAGMERLTGYPAEAMVGQPARAPIHPDDRRQVLPMLDRVARTPGAEFRGELRVLHADGTYRYTETVSTNLQEDPDIQGILIQAYDITARKEAEEALRESETRLRSTLRQLPAMLWLVDRELRILEASGNSLYALGFSPEAVCGRPLADFLALMENGAEVATFFQRVLEGQPMQWEAEFLGRTFRVFAEPFRDREGAVIGVLTIALDITESTQVRAELQEKENLHRLITENSIELVALYTPDGTTTYVSPACEAMLGYTPQEYADSFAEALVHPDDLGTLLERRRLSLRGEPMAVSFRIRKKDGEYVWFETMTRPVREEGGKLVAIVASSRDITERRRFEEQLTHVAYHDEQTGLPNRVAFMERLAERLAQGDGVRIGVIYLDLDNIEVINESLGLEAGDLVVNESANRLREALAPRHFVTRCGGDEFAILVELPVGSELPQDLCERIFDLFARPVSIGYREVQVACNIGLSLGRAGESVPGELLRQANTAMRHARAQGLRSALFHPQMSAGAIERLELDADLRRAIRQGELQLHYQPIIDLESSATIGVEALVRWRHPVRGWIPPSQFIPLAEQTGYIGEVGRWVLEKACQEARRWLDRGVDEERFSISVNLSPVQFQRTAIVEEIDQVLAESGLPAHCLTLELTESTLMKSPGEARVVLQRLKALGIRIAIDDFGTGHSSLSYLKKFPVDILKLDRSFVSGLGESLVDRELARTVVGLARALNLRVTAEGVESQEQVAELREIGCHKAQGYLFARPVPPDEIMMLLMALHLPGVH